MNLFLNAVSNNWKLILFDINKKIISEKDFQILWNESEKLIWIIDEFLDKNNMNYSDLENIVVVAGPWSFTWIRTIVLLVNTINFVIKKNITSLNYFDLFENFPVIKSSSKRDSFFKKDKNSEIEVIKNDDILEYLKQNNIKKLYWENKALTQSLLWGREVAAIKIFEKIDYCDIINKIEFKQEKIIKPIYIKKPSIS